MVEGLEITLFIILIGISLSIVYRTWKNGISPMPSSPKARKAMLDLIPAGFQGNIYELGSGWGKLAFELANRFPQSHVTGYETSPVPYYWSRLHFALFLKKT